MILNTQGLYSINHCNGEYVDSLVHHVGEQQAAAFDKDHKLVHKSQPARCKLGWLLTN